MEFRYGERANHATDLTTVVDPLAKEWKSDYDAFGYPVAVTDPMNHVTKATFDRWGRKLTETGPRGNLSGAPDPAFTSQYTYERDNRVRMTSVPNPPRRRRSPPRLPMTPTATSCRPPTRT